MASSDDRPAPPSPNAEKVRSAVVKQIRHAAGASGTPVALNATARPWPGRCHLLPHRGSEAEAVAG